MSRPASCLLFLFCLSLFFSCKRQFKTEKEEVAYWNALVLDSAHSKLYTNKDTTAALQLYNASIQKSSRTTAFIKAARFDLLANYFYFFTTNNEATANMVDSALAVFSTPALQNSYPRTYVGFLLFGGHLAYRLQQYNKANEYYFKAKKQGEAYLDPCEQKAFNYSIAMVLYRQQNFSQSLNYFKQAYALQNTCKPQTTAVALQQQEIQSNIGLCLIKLERYDSALVHFDKALEIANQYRDSLGPVSMDKIYGVVYGNQAQVYMAKNQLNEAEQLCRKSIALNARAGYEVEHAEQVKLQLAEVYGRQTNYTAMGQVLQNLRQELDTLPNPGVEVGWRQQMATYYEQTGHPQQGLAAFKNYITLRDSIYKEQEKLSDADVTRQLDVKEKERQITLLKTDKQITLIFLWVSIGASLMGLMIFALIYQNYLRSKKNLAISLALNEEINHQKAAREEEARQRHKEITEAVIQAQENERALIGLELHDNINQVLTTVKLHQEMVLEGVGDPKLILPRASKYLQECINEIRSLSRRLSAPSLGQISLEESVHDLLNSVNLTSKMHIIRKISGIHHRALQQDLHIGIYRILQEQLNNILKHAEASEVLVELQEVDHSIRLFISDNGKGFSLNSKKAGIGLKNMQTRAENLNGSFELTAAPGAGCRIEVIVPVV